MRLIRNLSFLVLLGLWIALPPSSVFATDLDCEGEDQYGSTQPQHPTYCSGQNNCCDYLWDLHAEDTIEAFCWDYGGPDWESPMNYYDASSSSSSQCLDFVIHCACLPGPGR